jgi:DNA-binding NarL/FixJ family response regulator
MGDHPRGGRHGTAGIPVAIIIEDQRLAQRIAAAVRNLPELDLPATIDFDSERPDIIVTDRPPAEGGQRPDAALICLIDRAESAAALRAGAAAVLPRSAGAAELQLAIAAVQHGLLLAPAESFAPPEVEEELGRGSTIDDGPAALTAREREVLRLLAEGATNKQIARRLELSVHTVKFHVGSILDKLDATGRTDAVAHAVRLGLLLL